ncbi:MAG: hypothetical protein KGI98_14845 [Euryarchaeota archaeon]|nr:hypothetical protein [Euryarchaeota archaeon]MDE1879445.1 hypothetical protein [Euryarchaeota archaeon]
MSGRTFYHATRPQNVPGILSRGLLTTHYGTRERPSSGAPYLPKESVVYLAKTPGAAAWSFSTGEEPMDESIAILRVELPPSYPLWRDHHTEEEGYYTSRDIPPEYIHFLYTRPLGDFPIELD